MTLGVPGPDDHLYRLPLGHDADGRPRFAPPYASVIGTGAPRTGKTRGLAIPAVASYPGSAVVVSVRGDVFEQTRASRARRGPVAVFDPAGLFPDAPERTSWDLFRATKDFEFAMSFARSLAGTVVGHGGATDWGYWYTMGSKLIGPMMFAAGISGHEMTDVVRWVQTEEEFEVRSILQAYEPRFPECQRAMQMLDAVWGREQRVRDSIIATADGMIAGYETGSVAAALEGGIDLQEFLNVEGSTLYVLVPPTNQALFAPIVTALLGAALDAAVARAERANDPARILVVLDEAGNIGQIPDLRSRSSTSMGFGVTTMSLLHDHSQLRRVYGADDAQSILANHHTVVGLRSSDPHTAAFFDALIGLDPDPSLPQGTGVARLRRIPKGHAIVAIEGEEPKLFRLPSLDDPLLRIELEI